MEQNTPEPTNKALETEQKNCYLVIGKCEALICICAFHSENGTFTSLYKLILLIQTYLKGTLNPCG